jgi:hypothetical protein
MNGNYGFSPNQAGKCFALTLTGATAFAAAPMNAGTRINETTLPKSVLDQGCPMIDPGANGAGRCVHFSDTQLASVYRASGEILTVDQALDRVPSSKFLPRG